MPGSPIHAHYAALRAQRAPCLYITTAMWSSIYFRMLPKKHAAMIETPRFPSAHPQHPNQ